MARLQFVTVRESDLGAGIDQQSSENQIAEGFTESLENADPKSTGQIVKRTGYQGYAGYVPVRVQEVNYDGTNIEMILDDSIQLPINQSSPIIIQGLTSVGSGDFASENIIYYDNFVSDIRKTFLTGTNTLSILQSEHDLTTPLLFVGTASSTSAVNNNNSQFNNDSISIDTSTFDINIDYTNNTGSNFEGFVFSKDKSAVVGETYVQTGNTVNPGTTTFTITAATHVLDNNNIIVKAYEDTGTEYISIDVDEVFLNDNTGDIDIKLVNTSGSAFNAVFILASAPTANFATGSVAASSTQSIVIDTSVDGGSDFAFVACYLEPTVGGILEQILPDSIVNDVDAKTITITFTNNNVTGANFEIYWDFAYIVTNKLSVIGNITANFTDTQPQLTIWGLCHEEIYGTREAREGWVNHIDSYRAPGETRLISGLGGNLFAARHREEGVNATDYLMPLLYPRLRSRVAADTVVGPAFYDTGDTPGRTRGFITGDNGSTNFFEIESITYNSGTGFVDYTLVVPNMVVSGTLTDIISSTTGLEDEFTAQQCGYAAFNGVFTVKSVATPTASTLVISVSIPSIDGSDFDEVDVGGLGGVFTDRLSMTTTSPFLSDDIIASDIFDDTDIYTCVNSLGTTTVFDGLVDIVSVPGGLRMVGTRTSSVLPVRNSNNISSIVNLVRGDMLDYTGINRQLRIKGINQLDDIAVSIVGDGVDATVTLGSGDTTTLFIGKQLLISGTTSYNGAQTITDILSNTEFKFESSTTTTESGTLIGKTIQIDEELTFSDTTDSSVSINVDSRWIPIESPTDNFNLTPTTNISYFDTFGYDNQSILRSTMVQDNLYLTNSDDEVMKFDGTNIYRSGLPRWQSNAFLTTDIAATGRIVMDNPVVSFTAISTNQFTVTAGDEKTFTVGDIIQSSTDEAIYTIVSTDTSGKLIVNKTITGAGSGDVIRTRVFKYYFRLNAVDANDNVIASAVTGNEDSAVRLGIDAAVNIKLIGMPALDIYDYDRLEVQIYRTKGDEPAPFYRLATLAMPFNSSDGYIQYIDTAADEDLTDLDEVNTALKGAELGTAWGQPMRAKYCTTAGNRLILGNLKDYATLDIRVIQNNNGRILPADFYTNNNIWTFRKDSSTTGVLTDMLTTVTYEFSSNNKTVVGITGSAGANFSVNVVGHGMTPGTNGQWIYLYHSAVASGNDLRYSGWWHVGNVTDANNIVVNSSNTVGGAAVNFPDKVTIAADPFDVPISLEQDGNYATINGNRPAGSTYEFLAMKRMAEAINASMRKVDTSRPGYENFKPWMVGNAGNEFEVGQLIVKQLKVFDTFLEVVLPNLDGALSVFVNNVKRNASDQASALTRLYPSRIIASYQNYPEIFDNPAAVTDTESDSVIDINSADGQEITAIIPFFGDAAFGAAQKSGIIVVFKTNSVYLVDLAAKDAGQNAVQRLETRGKGCTAPYSVAVTRGGIMFANDTGIYRLGRDLRVEYIGRKYERLFKTTVNKQALELATGHHDTEANSYKLSYPVDSTGENSKVAVYNHTREYEQKGDGSWTTYTNHPATGWANLDASSYMSTTDGRVHIIRKLGEDSDYRDDDKAIELEVITRAMDMLESGRRKVFSKIITHFRTISGSIGTALFAALDLKSTFQSTDAFEIKENTDTNGLGDSGNQKVVTIASTFDEKVGVYLQLKYTNSTLDENIEISGIDIRVAGKSDEGITEAKETTE